MIEYLISRQKRFEEICQVDVSEKERNDLLIRYSEEGRMHNKKAGIANKIRRILKKIE